MSDTSLVRFFCFRKQLQSDAESISSQSAFIYFIAFAFESASAGVNGENGYPQRRFPEQRTPELRYTLILLTALPFFANQRTILLASSCWLIRLIDRAEHERSADGYSGPFIFRLFISVNCFTAVVGNRDRRQDSLPPFFVRFEP
jgi:hypothetical protein